LRRSPCSQWQWLPRCSARSSADAGKSLRNDASCRRFIRR
jgi:hypothetical protein